MYLPTNDIRVFREFLLSLIELGGRRGRGGPVVDVCRSMKNVIYSPGVFAEHAGKKWTFMPETDTVLTRCTCLLNFTRCRGEICLPGRLIDYPRNTWNTHDTRKWIINATRDRDTRVLCMREAEVREWINGRIYGDRPVDCDFLRDYLSNVFRCNFSLNAREINGRRICLFVIHCE